MGQLGPPPLNRLYHQGTRSISEGLPEAKAQVQELECMGTQKPPLSHPSHSPLADWIANSVTEPNVTEAVAVTAPPGWVCPRERPRPNPRPSGLAGGGHLPRTRACPPQPACSALPASARPGGRSPPPTRGLGRGVRGPRRVWARPPNARPARHSSPARPRPGPHRPRGLPAASRAGVEGQPAPAPRPAPRALPPAPAAHSPRARRAGRAAAGRRGRAGPARPALHKVTAPELRGGGAWAPEVPPPGPAPPAPTGGHFRSRGVERGSRRGRAWRERKRRACERGRSGSRIPVPPLGTPVPHSWEPQGPLSRPKTPTPPLGTPAPPALTRDPDSTSGNPSAP
ncbi:translation initiation factor IF-2-like [Zalophus californianus]|uniref:Translation initiation factor IF-2-like n=1 Tax=Zalophus californianus TaxID=9704 RepID=A0A6P9EX52_ZALCA|nr:translation initiation factor IF-2-like [Zalophus californianus]